MHKFLRAIGFSDITKKDLEIILEEITEHPNMMKITKDSDGNEFAELSIEYAKNMGITLRGTYYEDDSFVVDYYFPYFYGTEISTREMIDIEKHAEKESYAGVCDDVRIGVTLIFYLQNVADYLSERSHGFQNTEITGAVLSGLSTEGKILLPILQKEKAQSKVFGNNRKDRSQLIAEAREGNEEAMESLTLDDMDTYSCISRRIQNEDILSIVSSTFMPYGIESDQYSILGDIIDMAEEKNRLTKEKIYCLKVRCNDMIFDVCINEKDLMGEPAIGRRFKGNIWMQGSIYLS